MVIKELKTERITNEGIKSHINKICSSIDFYGKCGNIIFMMNDQNTGIFDLMNNKFIVSNQKGVAYPVVDNKNNNYFMIINDKGDEKVRYNNYGQPRYYDTSYPYHMYDDEKYFRDRECFCNVFDENGKRVCSTDKYLANIYQINSVLDKDGEYKSIKYRDIDDGIYYSGNTTEYNSYSGMPTNINEKFEQILSSDSMERIEKNKSLMNSNQSFNLDVFYTKWRYSVINRDKGLLISYDENIKHIEVVDNDIIMLINNKQKCALYDVNKGYLINFDEELEFSNVSKLTDNVFKLQFKNGYKFFIKNDLSLKTYKDVYMTSDEVIVANDLGNIELYNKDGDLLLNIKSQRFYKCDDDIFYFENNKCYHYNLKNNLMKEINILSLFKLEDGTKLNTSLDEILENFMYYYFDKDNNDFILFKDKKVGIEIDLGYGGKGIRWFDTIEQKDRYLQSLTNYLINIPIDDDIENSKCNKRVKKMN